MIERKTTKNGLHYFTVKADNGHIIVYSQNYSSEAARENGIASLKKYIERELYIDLKS